MGAPDADTSILLSDHFFEPSTLEALGPVVAHARELAPDPLGGARRLPDLARALPRRSLRALEIADEGVDLIDSILVQMRPSDIELVPSGRVGSRGDTQASPPEQQPPPLPLGIPLVVAGAAMLIWLALLLGGC